MRIGPGGLLLGALCVRACILCELGLTAAVLSCCATALLLSEAGLLLDNTYPCSFDGNLDALPKLQVTACRIDDL